MAETPYAKFRLAQHTLDDLDCLAAGQRGNRSAALRDAIHYWGHLVHAAGKANAEEFSRNDWVRLAHLNDPNGPSEDQDYVRDWGKYLAVNLCGMWESRQILPLHKVEKRACDELASRISSLDLIRGYALYLCLSHFWGTKTTESKWWEPDVWMKPLVKEEV